MGANRGQGSGGEGMWEVGWPAPPDWVWAGHGGGGRWEVGWPWWGGRRRLALPLIEVEGLLGGGLLGGGAMGS